jgi:hypothetical protein
VPQPTKKHWIGYPQMAQTATALWHVRLPNPAEAGDTIIIVGQWGNGADIVSAIADDQGGSLAGGQWVKDKIQSNATDNQSAGIFRRSNVPAGTRVVTITLSSSVVFTQFAGLLVNNLAPSSPVDGTPAGANPTGTSIAAGNITTSTTDTFVVFYAACTSGAAIPALCLYTAPANYDLWAPDPCQFSCSMAGSQVAAGTFNPTLTSSKSWTRSIAMAVAYKTATSGGAPKSTMEVLSVQAMTFNATTGSPGTTIGPFNVPMQAGVNTIAMSYDDGNQIFNTDPKGNTSSNPSNTFDGTNLIHGGNNPARFSIGWVYKVGASVSPQGTMTLKVSSTPTQTTNGFCVFIWGISNVTSFDTSQDGFGLISSVPPVTQNNVLSTAIQTSVPDQLILLMTQEERQTPTSVVATNGTLQSLLSDLGVYQGIDGEHDTGYGHLYAASPGSFNFNLSFSDYELGGNVEEWAAQAISFKQSFFSPQVGRCLYVMP